MLPDFKPHLIDKLHLVFEYFFEYDTTFILKAFPMRLLYIHIRKTKNKNDIILLCFEI